jgi:hypothetical protein
VARTRPVANAALLTVQPTYIPGVTWGLGNQGASYVPGPGGPIPDPRRFLKALYPGPVYGRVGALSCLRAFGPPVGVYRPWPPIAPWNNAWAPGWVNPTVPGWYKPPPTANDGF